MSTTSRLLAATLLIPPLVLLQQHLRLRSAYPTRHITPSLEISTRSDAPAVGMSSSSGWLRPDAGEEFTADVPARLLVAGDGTMPMSVVFARAFWGSWPLALERRLVTLLVRLNVGPFGLRGGGLEGEKAAEAERNFEPKAKVIGGLFMVEAHDAHPVAQPDTNIAGPIICSWWLKPVAAPSKDRAGVAGGYHSFSVETLPASPLSPADPIVRLHFTCHMVLSGNTPANKDPEASTRPSEEITGLLSFTQRVLMTFHVFYARVLLDLAVRRLRSGAVWSE